MNPVATYCEAFAKGHRTPIDFARYMRAIHPDLCLRVIEEIGSWPSSEPELAALQRIYR